MAALTTVNATRATNGVDLTGVAAAAGGDTFTNTGQEVFVVKNGGGSPITVTFVTPVTVDVPGGGLAVADLAVTVAAGAQRLVGPFPPPIYNDSLINPGNVSVTYSAVTTVTVNVVKVTPA